MDEQQDKKGFAGLSSLTSKIEEHVAVDQPERRPEAGHETPKKSHPNKPKSSAPRGNRSSTPPKLSPSAGKSDSSGWKWLLGIIAVVAIGFAVYHNDQRSHSPTPSSTYTPPATAYKPDSWNTKAPSAIAPKPKQVPSRPKPEITFDRPPIGRDNVLSVAQIRWCLRQDMRLGVRKQLIKNNQEVRAFNLSVGDYNSRCGSYRYRRGTLERAKREIENLRIKIEATARINWDRKVPQTRQNNSIIRAPSKNLPIPRAEHKGPSASEIREVQRLLTLLGYNPGAIDGRFGRRTANAIKKFQNDTGRSVTGQVSRGLITVLKAARKKASGSSTSGNLKAPDPLPSIQRAQFFAVLTNKEGKREIFVSNKILHDTKRSCYGWRVKLSRVFGDTVELREILKLPSKPLGGWPVVNDGSRQITPSSDQKSATTKRTLKIKNGWVSNMWCIAEGDPLGPYAIDIYLNKQFVKTFEFEVTKAVAE